MEASALYSRRKTCEKGFVELTYWSCLDEVSSIVKRIAIRLLPVAALLAGLILWFHWSTRPPDEAKLVKNFHMHRASFESLRDMLETDTQIHRLAEWGVQTDKGISKPPAGDFPVERYNKYLSLLKDVGGVGAGRDEGAHANPVVLLWGTGFGGDAAHVGICWMDDPPTREVSSLNQYYRDHKSPVGKGWVCQHIDQQWYLWTDLWTE
jgi:hypothetical protein